jgi:hypothetical protein
MKEEDILGQSLVIVVSLCFSLGPSLTPPNERRSYINMPLFVIQCNLKPATMRGVKSYAMLLCVSGCHCILPHTMR